MKAPKCQIVLAKVTYLGHKVGQGSVCPLQATIEAIPKWPVPETKNRFKAFWG